MGVPVPQSEQVTAPSGTGTTITIGLTSLGYQEDDVIEIQVGWKGNQAPTTLTGWTHRFTNTTGTASNGLGQGTWWKRVGPSETISDPVLTIGATAVERRAIAYCIRGADIDNPANTFWQKQQTVGNSATPTPPAITTLAPNYLLLHLVSCRGNSAITPPTGYNEEQDTAEGTTICTEGSTKTQATAGSVSGQAASISSNRWVAAIIGIPSPDYPYFRSQTSATATATNVTPALPTGTTNADFYGRKDLLLLTAEAPGDTPTPNTPGDWTEIWSTTTSGGATNVKKWWTLYDGSVDTRVNRATSGEISVQLCTYRNPHQTSPIGNVNVRQNASSTTSTWDALTRSFTKSTVNASCVADGVPAYTSPASWTERSDGNGITTSDQIFEDTGSTASASFTLGTASPTAVGLVEIKSWAGVAGSSDLPLTLSDNAANLADAMTKVGGQLKTFVDDINLLADVSTRQMEHRLTFADDTNLLADGEARVIGTVQELADTLTALADEQAQLLVYLLALADTTAANWADEHQLLLAHFLALSDTLQLLSDATTLHLEQRVESADTLDSLSDAVASQLGTVLELIDSLGALADAYVQLADGLLAFDDSFALTDTVSLGYGLLTTDALDAATDALEMQTQHLLQVDDAFALTDAESHVLHHHVELIDSVDNLVDSYSQQADGLLELTDSLVLTDSLALGYGLLVTDNTGALADAYSQQLSAPGGENIPLVLGDVVVLADDAALGVGLSIAEAIVLIDSEAATLDHLLPLVDNVANWADSVALSGGLQTIIADNMAALGDAVDLSSQWLLQFGDSLTLTDALITFGENYLQASDSFLLSDAIAIQLFGPSLDIIADDALTFDDAVALILRIEGEIELILSDVIVLADHYFDLRGPYTPSAKRHVVVPSGGRTVVVPVGARTTRIP